MKLRRRRRRRRQAEFSEKDVVVVVHERDVREGREAGSNGSHSCNVFEKRPKTWDPVTRGRGAGCSFNNTSPTPERHIGIRLVPS